MKTKTIDILNIIAILISAGLSFVFPFELFLFAYAVLGPLHYLTEIAWLNKRSYFTKEKTDGLLLILMATSYVAIALFGKGNNDHFLTTALLVISFGLAFVMATKKGHNARILTVIGLLLAILLLHQTYLYTTVFALFLPTIVHVFLFTALFMLYGAGKSKSKTGYLSVTVLIGAAILTLMPHITTTTHQLSADLQRGYMFFQGLHEQFAHFLGFIGVSQANLFQNPASIAVARFIAFAYTYHYLNWFTKTSVIGWHRQSKKIWATIIGIWVISVSMYAVDYRVGYFVLFFLSMLHVFLEFPLNHVSITGIAHVYKKKSSTKHLASHNKE